jgi:hypothetical protein
MAGHMINGILSVGCGLKPAKNHPAEFGFSPHQKIAFRLSDAPTFMSVKQLSQRLQINISITLP